MRKLFAVLLLMCGMAAAQCPVAFEKVIVHDISQPHQVNFKTKWTNIGDKTITGIKFGIVYFDATKDPHDPHENFASDQKSKPGDSKTSYWRNYLWSQHLGYRRADIWVKKIVFEDNTEWEDDGSKQCLAHSR